MILIIGGTGPLSLPLQDGRLSKTDAVMLSHPSDVSVGLLSCNNLISQRHTSTGLWRHLMSVALFSSVSNFMTSPLFYSAARSGLWLCNDNWEEKQCSAQLCTKSFCQEVKLWVYAYEACVCAGLVMKIITRWKVNLNIFCCAGQRKWRFFFQHRCCFSSFCHLSWLVMETFIDQKKIKANNVQCFNLV